MPVHCRHKRSGTTSPPWPALLAGALACGVAPCLVAAAEPTATDRAQLDRQVCREGHGTQLALARFLDDTRSRVGVVCQPHGAQLGLAEVQRAECRRERGHWDCSALADALALPNGDRYVFVALEPDVPAATAVAVVKYVAGLGWYQGYQLSDLVSGTCGVRRGPTGEWVLGCDYATLYVAEDPAPGGAARYRVFDVTVKVR